MIEKEQDFFADDDVANYTVSCDFCSFSEEFQDLYSWDELMSEMKKKGWRSVKKDGEWKHQCPTCRDKEMGYL